MSVFGRGVASQSKVRRVEPADSEQGDRDGVHQDRADIFHKEASFMIRFFDCLN